ncbi:MAG: YggT family protein [Oligoflexia bacterium]|nr:YggT family protein [Oligoflexia bacterium]
MVRSIIHLYILIIIADAVLSYVPQYRTKQWAQVIRKIADFSLDPIRKLLPKDLPFDVSPLIAIIVLQLIMALW